MPAHRLKAAAVKPFSFDDRKGNGATDLPLSGTPLEQTPVLCSYKSVKITDIDVKSRWRGTDELGKTTLLKKQANWTVSHQQRNTDKKKSDAGT